MEIKGKILVVDDEPDIREVIRLLLSGEGYKVVEAADGITAVRLAEQDFDVIILDVMMPGISGFSTCEQIRKVSKSPVLFLTAKSQESDKIIGFSVGGDDYLVKPFSYSELISRVKAMVRRYREYGDKRIPEETVEIFIKDIVINTKTGDVTREGEYINLTDLEFRMLLLLAQNPKKVFSAQNIFESVWGEPYYYSSNNTIMVHIRNLRKKLNADNGEEIIKTVWGKGYKIEC